MSRVHGQPFFQGGEGECSSQSAGQHLSGPVPTYEREAGLLGFSGQLGVYEVRKQLNNDTELL